jgi:hypothetical protein
MQENTWDAKFWYRRIICLVGKTQIIPYHLLELPMGGWRPLDNHFVENNNEPNKSSKINLARGQSRSTN